MGKRALRRVWVEHVPRDRWVRPDVLAELRKHALTPTVAVFPSDDVHAPDLVARLHGSGLPVGLWPMVSNGDGRWANDRNVSAFTSHTRHLVDGLVSRGQLPDEISIDFEPSFDFVRRAMHGDLRALRWLRVPRESRAHDAYSTLVRDIRSLGIHVRAVYMPFVLFDSRRNIWQQWLGTPLLEEADTIDVMLYTTLVAARGRWIVRPVARRLVGRFAARARARFGERASVSLGCIGTGVMGDEPTFRTPAELDEDVCAVRDAGIDDIGVYDLGGLLARGPLEKWMGAFSPTTPRPMRETVDELEHRTV